MTRRSKSVLSPLLRGPLAATRRLREAWGRLWNHALLAADLQTRLPSSVVVLGRISVFGNRDVRIGENALFYPDVHLETQHPACITLGEDVVLSRGVHIVAMAGVSVGRGTLIGEYSSIRDANHNRDANLTIRDSSHSAKPITIGEEVWIGRGVTVLGGVVIGDKATVGANAVVTRDVPAGETFVGIPAAPIPSGTRLASNRR